MTSAKQAHSRPVTVESMTRKAVSAAAIGNAIEWFDFGVYGFLLGIVGVRFFPNVDPSARTLAAFAVFAASFLFRPLGALLFGPLGDRIGRKRILAVTILLMAGSTAAIGLLPTYQQIGVWAPVLLILARMGQGFSTGGEYAGAATFISEYAPDKRRGFYGSWLEFGTLAGFGTSAGLVTLLNLALPGTAMGTWGWRIPFLVALPLGIIGLYLRLRLDETPTFRECVAAHDHAARSGLREVLAHHWREMLLCFGLVVLLNVADYTVLLDMSSYLTSVLLRPSESASLVIFGVLVAMMLVIVPIGSLSDRIGRKPLLLTSGFGFLLLSGPAFWLLVTNTAASVLAGLAIIAFCQVCFLAVVGSTLPAIFHTRVRYGGFAISYNVCTSLFGGTAPFMIAYLMRHTHNDFVPAIYLMTAAAVSIIPMLLIKETAGQPLRGTEAAHRVTAQPASVPPRTGRPEPA